MYKQIPHTRAAAPFRVVLLAPIYDYRDGIVGERTYPDDSGYFETFEGASARTWLVDRVHGDDLCRMLVLDANGHRVYRHFEVDTGGRDEEAAADVLTDEYIPF